MEAQAKKSYPLLLAGVVIIVFAAAFTSTAKADTKLYVSIGSSSRTAPTVIYRTHYPSYAYYSPRESYIRNCYRNSRHYRYTKYRKYYYNYGHYYRAPSRIRHYSYPRCGSTVGYKKNYCW